MEKFISQKDAKAIIEDGLTGSLRESGGQGGLSAIQADLDAGKYSNEEAFEADVKGVLQDFISSCARDDPLFQAAQRMLRLFDEIWSDADVVTVAQTSAPVKRPETARDSWSAREIEAERKPPVNPECKACMGKHVAHVSGSEEERSNIYIYICMYVCICMYIYVYIYIYIMYIYVYIHCLCVCFGCRIHVR
jgi:hypothetical protein